MKKSILLTLTGVMLCMFLTSCGIPKPPNEKEIKTALPEEITTIIENSPFDGGDSQIYDLEVQSLVIDKRQTNEKEDIAYVTIELENEWYHVTKHLVLLYNYYDKGGWILDDYYHSSETEVSLVGNPMIETAKNAAPYIIPGFTAEYIGCSEDFELGQITFHYQYSETSVYVELIHSYSVTYQCMSMIADHDLDSVSWSITGTEAHLESPFHSTIEQFFTLAEMLDPDDGSDAQSKLYTYMGVICLDAEFLGEAIKSYEITQINPTLGTTEAGSKEDLQEALEYWTQLPNFNAQFDDYAEVYVTVDRENQTDTCSFCFLYRNGNWDLVFLYLR